jgi:predicted butyrate kinase (DUF1464 family)
MKLSSSPIFTRKLPMSRTSEHLLIVLDPLSLNYDRWRNLILLTLECYALTSYVISDAVHLDVPAWRRMDAIVLSWLFGVVTTEFMETVRMHDEIARHTWLGIEAQ